MDNIKKSIFFDADVLDEIKREAKRLDWPVAMVVRQAWAHARDEVKAAPTAEEAEANFRDQVLKAYMAFSLATGFYADFAEVDAETYAALINLIAAHLGELEAALATVEAKP